MHVADFSLGMLGANGIVAAGCGIAAGAALSAAYRRSGQVAVSFFGDGGINKGSFHEALNFAGRATAAGRLRLREQPVRPVHGGRPDDLGRRSLPSGGRPTGFPARPSTATTRSRCFQAAAGGRRAGTRRRGPDAACNLRTYRFGGHFVGDAEEYATKEEVEGRREHDPIPRLEGRLVAGGHAGRSAGARAGLGRGRRRGRRGGAVRRGKPVPGRRRRRSRASSRERAPGQLRPGHPRGDAGRDARGRARDRARRGHRLGRQLRAVPRAACRVRARAGRSTCRSRRRRSCRPASARPSPACGPSARSASSSSRWARWTRS